MATRYRGNAWRTVRYTGQMVYEALVRMPDGHQETLYVQQRCGNDMRSPEVADQHPGDSWRFVADETVIDTTQPAVDTAVPAVAVTAPTAVTTTTKEEDGLEDGVIRIEVRKATNDQPAMIKVVGIDETSDNTIVVKEGIVQVRYTPRQK